MGANWYSKVFAKYYDGFMDRFERVVLYRRRKKLLRQLKGRILEIGSGTGVNFSLYSPEANVMAIEPSSPMMDKARKKLEEGKAKGEIHANIELQEMGIGSKDIDKSIPPKSMDAVVCTLVLCTIPDPDAALDFIHSRLKPSGKLIVLEHVQAKSVWGRWIQNILNPAWKIFAEGCHLNRDTEAKIRRAGFLPIESEDFRNTMPFHQGVYALPD